MTNQFISRIKSAAFVRKYDNYENNPEYNKKQATINNIPMS